MKKQLLAICAFTINLLLSFSSFAQLPSLIWVKQQGGTSLEEGKSIAVDASGNVYTTGNFAGTVDFDPGSAVSNLTANAGFDIFVSKLDAAGNFVWASQFGGSANDYGTSIAIDAAGNVLTTGYFQDAVDFDPGAGVANLTSLGSDDIFILKLDPSGNLAWVKQLGGATGGDVGNSITVDGSNNVITTGSFLGTVDFDPGAGVTNLTAGTQNGPNDIFISKLDAAGNFVWAQQFGGPDNEYGYCVKTDAAGNVYTTGKFQGLVDFDPGASISTLYASPEDIFVSKLDAGGNFVWAKKMGSSATDVGKSIAVDAAGNVYTTGYFKGIADFDPSAASYLVNTFGNEDVFISKLDAAGNFVWAKTMGGTLSNLATSIALDAVGNVLVTGYSQGTGDFNPDSVAVNNLVPFGLHDAFIVKLDAAGNFIWVAQLGGTGDDYAYAITADAAGAIYTTGYFQDVADFDPGAGVTNLTPVGSRDIFVHKMAGASVGINEYASQHTILLYPNPANGSVSINIVDFSNEAKISIYNSLGEMVLQETITTKHATLDIQQLTKGLYLLKTESNGNYGSAILIKE